MRIVVAAKWDAGLTIVIVGGGHAAGQAAASLRQEGYDETIVVVGDEPHLPYQRPPLSKEYLAGEQGLERIHLRPQKFYADRDIEVRSGVRVSAIDRARNTVICDDDTTLAYDRLLLATGSRPRRLDVPGCDLAGVCLLRTIADADSIRDKLKAGAKLVIVGGGYIGLEVASVAVQHGLDVTVLEMEERILARVTTPAMSAFYHRLHTGKGVTIRTGARAAAFAGNGRLAEVRCDDGTSVPADLAVVGVGIVPNVELAEEAGLACDNGIVVDERAGTADERIYAAGDCTNHPNPLLGRRLRLESVPNAMEQSRVAAANMAGGERTYASVPWFWSDQYDLKLQMVGFSTDAEHEVVRGDPDEEAFATFHFRGDTLIAADAVNRPREFMVARQLVGRTVDASRLADPTTDLKSLLSG
ncbi:MAG: FAD-dependent oxidoreductase [Gammaproteobacteria bacterium]|nr:FAD-dependent oxidoreductase [Gammaproteobacteria bacterium]